MIYKCPSCGSIRPLCRECGQCEECCSEECESGVVVDAALGAWQDGPVKYVDDNLRFLGCLGLIAAFFGFGPIGWPLCILLGICIYLDDRAARKRRR